MSKEYTVIFSDGSETGDFPVAVKSVQVVGTKEEAGNVVVDPIFDSNVTRNLYGRVMTLVEATTDSYKLQAVKDLFGKELRSWETDVYDSAREITNKCDSSNNIYTRNLS